MGALDGTHIKVIVPTQLKGRYRSRKADIVTNVLGVCAPDMQFIYVLPGWEGSAHDGRVLRDAITRPNGLHIPQGEFGFVNSCGFLISSIVQMLILFLFAILRVLLSCGCRLFKCKWLFSSISR